MKKPIRIAVLRQELLQDSESTIRFRRDLEQTFSDNNKTVHDCGITNDGQPYYVVSLEKMQSAPRLGAASKAKRSRHTTWILSLLALMLPALLIAAGITLTESGQLAWKELLFSIQQPALLTDNPNTERTLNDLIDLCERQKQYQKAIQYELRLLNLMKSRTVQDVRQIALHQKALGDLFDLSGDAETAKHYWKLARKTIKETSETLCYYGKNRQAEPYFAAYADITAGLRGKESSEYAGVALLGAQNLLFEGKFAEAEKKAIDALTLLDRAPDRTPTSIAMLTDEVASIYLLEGDNSKAEFYLRKALGILEQEAFVNTNLLGHLLADYTTLLLVQSKNAEAEQTYKRAIVERSADDVVGRIQWNANNLRGANRKRDMQLINEALSAWRK